MLSKKAKHALQALQYSAQHYEHDPTFIAELAEKESIPQKIFELILLLLDWKNHRVLQSKKCKGGSYLLGKPRAEISRGQVIRQVDGPVTPLSSISQIADRKCEECRDETTCGMRLLMNSEGIAPRVKEAAARLGAHREQPFTRVILPAIWPALPNDFAMAFARAVGKYGSVIFVAGNMAVRTEITPLLIATWLEQFDYAGATALAVVVLAISCALLINGLQALSSSRRHN